MKKLLWILILSVNCLALFPDIYLFKINGFINSITVEYLHQHIEKLSATSQTDNNSSIIIIQLDTPGGFDSSMREIIKEIMNAPLPTVVFVTPTGARAASAGFFITLAADIAVMSPGTNMGAAHPVSLIPDSNEDSNKKEKTDHSSQKKIMAEKVINDSVAYIRSLAKSRGRNQELAALAVTESKSYTAEECLENNLINYIAADLTDLIQKIDQTSVHQLNGKEFTLNLKHAAIKELKMTARQRFLETITIPNLAFILLIAGILGLFLEFKNPGLLVPGILGGICLLLAFMAFQILPLNSSGLLLIILSVILFIAEIKVQGFGMLGLGGIISFVFGSIILIDSPLKEMRPSMSVIIIIALSFAAIILFLSFKVMQVMKKKTETGIESFIGKIGLAKTDINAESGQVFVYGEWWNAVSEVPIKANSKVMVDEVNNFVLKVSKLI